MFTHERFSTAFQVLSLILLIGYGVSKSDDEWIVQEQLVSTKVSQSNALPIGSHGRLLIQSHKYYSVLNKKPKMQKSILTLRETTFIVYPSLIYLTDIDHCRRETANTIATNQRSMAELRGKMANKKQVERTIEFSLATSQKQTIFWEIIRQLQKSPQRKIGYLGFLIEKISIMRLT